MSDRKRVVVVSHRVTAAERQLYKVAARAEQITVGELLRQAAAARIEQISRSR